MLRSLRPFCERNSTTPKDPIKLQQKLKEDLLLDCVTIMESEKKAPNYIINVLKAVKSRLDFNGIQIIRRIKVTNSTATPTIKDERVQTHKEIRTIILYADERIRVAISLMAFSGLRPMTLSNTIASDGLKVRDLPELKIEAGRVAFEKVPTMVKRKRKKNKIHYFT